MRHAMPSRVCVIRPQELPDLLTADGARFAYSTWLASRLAGRGTHDAAPPVADCLRQQRFPETAFHGGEAITALEMFLARNANGGKMDAPSIKRWTMSVTA